MLKLLKMTIEVERTSNKNVSLKYRHTTIHKK